MDVLLRTGQTASQRSVTLAAFSWKTHQGEPVVFLLHLQGKNEEWDTVQKECISVVQHALLETEGDADRRFDSTLKELNGFLKGISLAQKLEDVHMIIALLDQADVLHVSHAGRGEAYLLRRGSASQITEYSSGKPLSAFVHVASGKLEARDSVVFSTRRLLRTMTPAQLAKSGQHTSRLLEEILHALDAEHEHAALATLTTPQTPPARSSSTFRHHPAKSWIYFFLPRTLVALFTQQSLWKKKGGVREVLDFLQASWKSFFILFIHPKSRKRAHLLLLAGTIGLILFLWIVVQLFVFGRRTHTREELGDRMEQIAAEISSAESRHLAGDTEGAGAILQWAEEHARQVLENGDGLFRVESLTLLDTIRMKREEMQNILRLSPRTVVSIAAKVPSVLARGFIGIGEGEFHIYDSQSLYRVILNTVEDPVRLVDQDLLVSGSSFPRFQTLAFLSTETGVLEFQGGQVTTMKTEDPSGWVRGIDLESFLRYLYILAPEKNQIFKYERLGGRYGPAVEYNVNGDLSRAIDMTIDTYVYVLQKGGSVAKLLRGESQPFTIRQLPDGALKTATKIFKVSNGNLYLLDPSHARIIVISDTPTTNGVNYLRQYVVEGEQVGELRDLFIDPDETHLFLLDEKRLHVIDLQKK